RTLQGHEIPPRWPEPRGPGDDRDGRAVSAPYLLYGRGEGRVVSDDRWRSLMDADCGRTDSAWVDGLDSGLGFRPERYLRWHRVRRCSQQRVDGSRRVQIGWGGRL